MRGIDVGVENGNGMGRGSDERGNWLGKEKKAWEMVTGMGEGKWHG